MSLPAGHARVFFPLAIAAEAPGDDDGSSRYAALGIDLVIDTIASFLGPAAAHTTLRFVSRHWLLVTERALRLRCSRLLATQLPSRFLAGRLEEALYRGCGCRAGPGAYADRLKALSSALRGNPELVAGLVGGALTPAALARLAGSPKALLTPAAELRAAAAAAALSKRAELPPPRPADVVGLRRCPRCGCDRQWRRLVLRAGLTDVCRASESLLCCGCGAEVPRDALAEAAPLGKRGCAAPGGEEGAGRAADSGGESEGEVDFSGLFLARRRR